MSTILKEKEAIRFKDTEEQAQYEKEYKLPFTINKLEKKDIFSSGLPKECWETIVSIQDAEGEIFVEVEEDSIIVLESFFGIRDGGELVLIEDGYLKPFEFFCVSIKSEMTQAEIETGLLNEVNPALKGFTPGKEKHLRRYADSISIQYELTAIGSIGPYPYSGNPTLTPPKNEVVSLGINVPALKWSKGKTFLIVKDLTKDKWVKER